MKIIKRLLRQSPIYVIIIIIFFETSCKKDKTTLKTPEDYRVTKGNQSFGAYINGQPWVADYQSSNNYGPIDIAMFDDYLPGFLPHYNYIWAIALKANEEISLYIPPPLKPGRVLLNSTTYPKPYIVGPPAYGMYEVISPNKPYMTNASVTGYIDIIRADTITRSIEGTFEFEAINTVTNEKIKITNGYFKKN